MTLLDSPSAARWQRTGGSWLVALAVGLLTVLAGIVVLIEPGTSLVVIAILVGAEFVVLGVYRFIRVFSEGVEHRAFGVVVGLLLIVIGLVLLRHLDLSLLLISTIVGVGWIVLGVSELGTGIAAHGVSGRGWLIALGLLSVIAGVITLAYPVGTLFTLALLLGIWLIVRGVSEMMVAISYRRRGLPSVR